MTKYNTYILQNGLRLIHLPSASQVVYCGYDIAAGTRDERLRVGDGTSGIRLRVGDGNREALATDRDARMSGIRLQVGEEGLAHFCEHMTFKGTTRRNALQIINAIEGLGGELNAFTNKEDTCFYAAISKEHFPQAVDVLTDIVFHSQYPQSEIDKEVQGTLLGRAQMGAIS